MKTDPHPSEQFRTVSSGVYALGAQLPGAPTLVLLPGIEGTARFFYQQVALAPHFNLLALDLPDGETLDVLAARVLENIPEEKFSVFGTSLGGLVGWSMAKQAPRRVSSLVALGTLPSKVCIPPQLANAHAMMSTAPRWLFSMLYRRRLRRCYLEEGIDRAVQDWLLSELPSRDQWKSRIQAILDWGLPPETGVPTMWLRGQVDREAPWDAAMVKSYLPQSNFETVPGGHRAMITHPGALHGVLVHGLKTMAKR